MAEQIDPQTLKELKVKLEQRRAALFAELEAETSPVYDTSEGREPGDAVDLASRQVLGEPDEIIRDKHREELTLIEQALRRIAEGSYGKNLNGGAIPIDRLKAIPWALRE